MNRVDIAVSAAAKLALFVKQEMQLHESHADQLVDVLVELLGDVRDCSYRLLPDDGVDSTE